MARLHLMLGTVVAVTYLFHVTTARAEIVDRRPRLIVTTDIGGDPDDEQSMCRLMLYANEFQIEGLIASASGVPGELKEAVTRPDLLRRIVGAYGQVRANLARHAPGYPPADELLGRIKSGNRQRGLDAIGEGRDTDGSQWIIAVVDRPDLRPVNISVWGGQTDLAQALWRVKRDRGEEGLRRFVDRVRIHDIDDQDRIAQWMWQRYPGMFYILSKAPSGRDKREGAYRGMYLGGDESITSRQWIDAHVRVGHGPLGELYPTKTWTAPNPHGVLKEGDTPSWLYFLPNGLGDPDRPESGSWGGRFEKEVDRIHRDAQDRVGQTNDARATVWRWRPAFQNDLAARMDWCTKAPVEANHAPAPTDGLRSAQRTGADAGRDALLRAPGFADADGDTLAYRWWVYAEAGTYRGKVEVENAQEATARLTVPADAAGKTIHVILEVTDDGEPALTAYRRFIVEAR